MKRDLDLVRNILVTAEKSDGPVDAGTLLNCCSDLRVIAFHVELMRENGLIRADVEYDGLADAPMDVTVDGITWDGYDYLDAIRSDKVWRKANDAISSSVGDTSLSVVKETCTMVATELIKTSLGIK